MITAYLHSLIGDWHEAADLAQETFAVAYRKMDDFDPNKPLGAWLRGIAKNLGSNAIRKKYRHRIGLAAQTRNSDGRNPRASPIRACAYHSFTSKRGLREYREAGHSGWMVVRPEFDRMPNGRIVLRIWELWPEEAPRKK